MSLKYLCNYIGILPRVLFSYQSPPMPKKSGLAGAKGHRGQMQILTLNCFMPPLLGVRLGVLVCAVLRVPKIHQYIPIFSPIFRGRATNTQDQDLERSKSIFL